MLIGQWELGPRRGPINSQSTGFHGDPVILDRPLGTLFLRFGLQDGGPSRFTKMIILVVLHLQYQIDPDAGSGCFNRF